MTTEVQTIQYKVKKDDNLWNIVKRAGFPPKDWKKILDAPYNKTFMKKLKKEKRSPERLFPGDIIFLPAFNIEDIGKKFDELKKTKDRLGEALNTLGQIDHQISQLRGKEADDIAGKKKKLKELEREIKSLKKIISEGNKPSAGESPGERAGNAIARLMQRESEGVNRLEREFHFLSRNPESLFSVATKRFETQSKLVQKNVNSTAKELKMVETELSKMLKHPY